MPDDSLVIISPTLRALADAILAQGLGDQALRRQVRDSLHSTEQDDATVDNFTPGYSSGSRDNVWRGLDAVCEALGNLALSLKPFQATDPLRLARQVSQGTEANQAEICLLGIDLLESLDQYPVIIHCDNELLFGVWLGPYHCASSVMTDPIHVRELIAANDLALIRTESLFGKGSIRTQRLNKQARESIELKSAARFDALLDVTALRQASGLTTAPRADSTLAEITVGISHVSNRIADEGTPTRLPDFAPPISDSAALASLAVALDMPRAVPNPRNLDSLNTIEQPFSAASRGELSCVLPADGDQRLAVKAASGQQNFCVIAPPGTGGTQTAVNVVSQLLARHSRVLVVASSDAYRDAFDNHIRRSGLANACEITWDAGVETNQNNAAIDHDPFDASTEEVTRNRLVRTQRERFNYARSLGPIRPGAWSLHLALGICALSSTDFESVVDWRSLDPDELPTPTELDELCARLRRANRDLRPAGNGRLDIIGQVTWTEQWQLALVDAAKQLSNAANELNAQAAALTEHLNIQGPPILRSDFVALRTIAENLQSSSPFEISMAGHADLKGIHTDLSLAIDLTEEFDQCRRNLSVDYQSSAETILPIDELNQLYQSMQEAKWPRSKVLASNVKRLLKKVTKENPDPINDPPYLIRMHGIKATLESLKSLIEFFPSYWVDVNSDFLGMSERLESAEQLAAAAETLEGISEKPSASKWLADLCRNSNTAASQLTNAKTQCEEYLEQAQRLDDTTKAFISLAAPTQRVSGRQGQSWLVFLAEMARNVVEHQWEIKDWVAWRGTAGKSSIEGFDAMLGALKLDDISDENLPDVIRYACAKSWLEKYLIARDPDLIDEIDQHREQPKYHREHSDQFRRAVAARVIDSNPRDPDDPHCVLASVSDLVDNESLEQLRFDVVVFVDAHRTSTSQAVRALTLGSRGIFFGDPFQPAPNLPGSLHHGMVGGLANANSLNQALSLGLPIVHLRQDYSATNPLLLNLANRLVPQVAVRPLAPANDLDQPLQITHIQDAIWGEQNHRDNLVEAVRTIEELAVVLRETQELPITLRPSIAVIALSDAQTHCLRQTFDAYRREHSDVNTILSQPGAQSVNFRTAADAPRRCDIVFLSTAVASLSARPKHPILDMLTNPDGAAALYRVLSSARHRLHIVTSIDDQDLDAHKFGNGGAGHLARWMQTVNAVPAPLLVLPEMPDALTQAVREGLSAKGWHAAIPLDSIGAGIDLIVEHPQFPGHSLAGVSTDAGFFMQPTHDVIRRDDCQERALSAAGWRIVQAWPLQWWQDKAAAQEQLHQELHSLLRQLGRVTPDEASRPQASTPGLTNVDKPLSDQYQRLTPADLPYCDPEAIMDADYEATLRDIINRVIDTEGPIRRDYLVRRIASLHLLSVPSDEAEQRIESFTQGYRETVDASHHFVWPADLDPKQLHYRPPSRHEDKRQLAEIAPEELKAIAKHFKISPKQHGAARALAKAIGIAYPASEAMRARLSVAVGIKR